LSEVVEPPARYSTRLDTAAGGISYTMPVTDDSCDRTGLLSALSDERTPSTLRPNHTPVKRPFVRDYLGEPVPGR